MTTFLVLTGDQADAVRGPSATTEGAALEPVALVDGRFILSTAVIDDPAHSQHRALLAALPRANAVDLPSEEV